MLVPGFNEFEIEVEGYDNIRYLGTIYDDVSINEIFKMSDVFCIPGTNGLGINQAIYWGLPCVTMNVLHSPEIIYLKNNKNGYIVENEDELSEKLLLLLEDNALRNKFLEYSKKITTTEADISIMYKGFLNAIKSVKETGNNEN